MENFKEKKSNLKIKFLFVFAILAVSTYFIIQYLANENKQRYLKQTTQTYLRAYNTIHNQYKDLADVIFSGLLRLGDVKNKLDNIETKSESQKNKIRKELYDKTIARYNHLKIKHIKSVNFILPDNTMFLKVKNPKKHGTQISNMRHVIKYIHENKKPINSYEIGKNGAGFRFAYPIIKEGKYLGILSITFGAEAITSGIMKQYYVLSNFYINGENFNKKILKKKDHLYKKSHHKGFLFDMMVLKELKKITRKDMKTLKPSNEVINMVHKDIMTKKASSLYVNGPNMIITSIPVLHTLTKQMEAFITVRSKGETLALIDRNHNIITILLIALIGAITFVIYQQNIKIIKENIDIALNLQKDKQLLEQAKMAQMGEMIGNIAHQWRQPLSTITTAASGVKVNHEFNILKDEEIPEFMDTIINNADYLSQTIDNFRDFIKEDQILKEVVLQEKIEKTLNIVSASLSSNYIKVINTIHYEEPFKINLIQGVLSQVLMNLLNNAKDIMIERETEDRWIELAMEKKDGMITISVEDNGGGIPEEIMPKIFEPYFTTKHQSQGTGLGLYMSKEIVKKHLGGDLRVENTSNGAKFYIDISTRLKEDNEKLS